MGGDLYFAIMFLFSIDVGSLNLDVLLFSVATVSLIVMFYVSLSVC